MEFIAYYFLQSQTMKHHKQANLTTFIMINYS